MCDECGCSEHHGDREIILDKQVLEANDALAAQNRGFCEKKRIMLVNVLGSPGSGKTTLIEEVCSFLEKEDVLVIQGDLESDVDKRRLEKAGVDCYQINTHSGCHLNAKMVADALMDSDLKDKTYIFVENVGNLVCPADVDLGQHMDVVVSSTTEGSDKPRKYPPIFRGADLVVISKTDLSDAVGFDEESYLKDIGGLNPDAKIIKANNKGGRGFDQVAEYIAHKREHLFGISHRH